jgi:hypothetical protein
MECDYTHLNHIHKKNGHQGHGYKRGLLYLISWAIIFCGVATTIMAKVKDDFYYNQYPTD